MVDWLLAGAVGGLVAASAALGAVVLVLALRAFRLTREPYLGSFVLGFLLLEAASLFALANRLAGSAAFYHNTLWVHETAQLLALLLIAASYALHRHGAGPRATRAVVVGTVGVFAAAVVGFLALPAGAAFAWRTATAQYLYTLGLLPVGWVLLRARLRAPVAGQRTVLAGFALLGLGQVAWAAWAATDAPGALLAAHSLLVLSLGSFAVALRPAWRP